MAQAGLELGIFLPQSPEWLRGQAHSTRHGWGVPSLNAAEDRIVLHHSQIQGILMRIAQIGIWSSPWCRWNTVFHNSQYCRKATNRLLILCHNFPFVSLQFSRQTMFWKAISSLTAFRPLFSTVLCCFSTLTLVRHWTMLLSERWGSHEWGCPAEHPWQP